MEGNYLVSVILITYNRPVAMLQRSLGSVICQTFTDYEIVVVNTNKDTALVKSISDYVISLNKENISILHRPGINNNQARNSGAEISKGKYISFLDDDDEWACNKLEGQICALEKDTSMIYSNYEIHDASDDHYLFFRGIPDNSDLGIRILGENVIGCTSMPLMTKTAFFDIGGFDESLRANQEWDLWIRMLQEHKVKYSPIIAGKKHNSPDSISNNKYRRVAGWFGFFIKNAKRYKMNPEQFICATGFFYSEMFNKNLFIIGTGALLIHRLFKITYVEDTR